MKVLAAVDEDTLQAIVACVRAAVGPYETPAGELELPGLTLLATGRRAA